MRAHPGGLLALAAVVAWLLPGCGDATDATDAAANPTATAAVPASESAPPTASTEPTSSVPAEEPVSVRETCTELYYPPAQLMPRAIEFVHGSPSAGGVADAADVGTALSDAARRAEPALAEDIEVVRTSVDVQRASVESGSGQGPDLQQFDAAVGRLAGHCEPYAG